MSTPLTANQMQALINKSGIPTTFYEGWQTRNRGQRIDGWGPNDANPTGVHGIVVHHTVTRDTASTIHLVRDVGQPENNVPPPLYQMVVDKSGHLHVIGWGRANHAGAGDRDVLNAVIAERFPLPAPNQANCDGNARFYGIAGINWGDRLDPWPDAQLDTISHVCALICRFHGWSERSVIGHLEWEPGKVDPRGPGGPLMPQVRQRVHTRLK